MVAYTLDPFSAIDEKYRTENRMVSFDRSGVHLSNGHFISSPDSNLLYAYELDNCVKISYADSSVKTYDLFGKMLSDQYFFRRQFK